MSNYHNNNGPFTVKHLADYISCEFKGDKSKKIHSINTIQDATSDQLAFVENPKYIKYLETTNAGLVIVNPDFADQLPEDTARILSKFVYADYSKLANLFYADKPLEGSIHKTAIIEQNVTISKNVEIKAGVVISEGAIIGSNTIIGANSFIGKNVQIGENNIIKNNVSIECTQLGSNNLIHSGAKIGQDGFGFAFDARTTEIIKVPQVGGVIIGNYVEIGANTTIDRGSLTNTTIGDMTKLDNLVQIGHNVKIGRLCQIVAQSGIAGSTEIGDGCVFGGQSGVAGHLKIADRVTLASKSAITKNISTVGEFLGGFPAVPIMQWRKANAIVNRLVKNKTNNNK